MKKPLVVLTVVLLVLVAFFLLWKNKGITEPQIANEVKEGPKITSVKEELSKGVESAQNSVTGVPPEGTNIQNMTPEERIKQAYEYEINYYGIVLDQDGETIPNANVFLKIDDQYFGKGTILKQNTQADGSFSILGKKGAGIYVSVEKEGYNKVKGAQDGINSSKKITFFRSGNKTSPKKPEIFRLISKDALPKFITNKSRIKLPKNGEEKTYTIKGAEFGEVSLSLEQNKPEQSFRDWPWKFKIKIKDGGLLKRDNLTLLNGPKEGYRESLTIDMTKNRLDSDPWQKAHIQSYFIKLKDETYGIFDIQLFAETGLAIITTQVNEVNALN